MAQNSVDQSDEATDEPIEEETRTSGLDSVAGPSALLDDTKKNVVTFYGVGVINK